MLVKIGVVLILLPCAVFFARFAFRGMSFLVESFTRGARRQFVEDILMTALSIVAVAAMCRVIVWIAGL